MRPFAFLLAVLLGWPALSAAAPPQWVPRNDPTIGAELRKLDAGDNEAHDALDEVNAARAKRGLRPFIRDEGLTAGALNLAAFRARHGIRGHSRNDFAGLPRGVRAPGAGCAAWKGGGWGSCFTYSGYRYAGAAWCYGRNGLRYMHLFVSDRQSSWPER